MISLSLRLLCLFILAWTPKNQGFLPTLRHNRHTKASSAPLHYVVNDFNDIDIDDVLAQTEQALMLAQDNLSTSDSSSIEKELSSISKMQEELENDKVRNFIKNKKELDEKKTTGSPSSSSQFAFGDFVQRATHNLQSIGTTTSTPRQELKQKKVSESKSKHQGTTVTAKSSSKSVFGNWAEMITPNKKAQESKTKQQSAAGPSKSSSQSVFGNWSQKTTPKKKAPVSKSKYQGATESSTSSSKYVFGNWAKKTMPKKEAPQSKSKYQGATGSSKSSSNSMFGNWAQKTMPQKKEAELKSKHHSATGASKSSSKSVFGNWAQKTTTKKKVPESKSKHQGTTGVSKSSSKSAFGNWAKKSKCKKKAPVSESKHQSSVIKENIQKTLQQASNSANKAIQDGLESKELQDLKAKATKTFMESVQKPNKKEQQLIPELIDVSDREIDISDVLAEAEAALLAAESTSNASTEGTKVSDREIGISDVLAESTSASSTEATNVSDREIDTDVFAEANEVLSAAESASDTCIEAKIVKEQVPTKQDKKEKTKPMEKRNVFQPSKESPKIKSDHKKADDTMGISVEAVFSTTETAAKREPKSKSKENTKTKRKGLFENFQLPKVRHELIDVSDRDIDISDVMAEAEAALLLAESAADSAMPSGDSASTMECVPNQSSEDLPRRTSLLSQKWADTVAAFKHWNEGASPVRKSNRAILLYNLVQFTAAHRDLLVMVAAQITFFLKVQNQRLSPIRKKNRSCMAHTIFQYAVLQKLLVIEAIQASVYFAKSRNEKMRPIRMANRDALACTFAQSVLVHKNLVIGARDSVVSWARTQNTWMAPIRAENRKNLIHTLSRFLLLQRYLFRFAKAQAFVWWSRQSKRMKANRSVNYAILSHDIVETLRVQKDIYRGLRAAPSKASAVLSRIVTILNEQIEEEAVPVTPEIVLESSF